MESNDLYKNGIPQFDGKKSVFWSIRMKTYIQAQGFEIWQPILDGYTTPVVPPTNKAGRPESKEEENKSMEEIFEEEDEKQVEEEDEDEENLIEAEEQVQQVSPKTPSKNYQEQICRS